MENIAQNMAAALENLPEAFGRVTMLYVNIEVNGHPVKAFVDRYCSLSSPSPSWMLIMQCLWPVVRNRQL